MHGRRFAVSVIFKNVLQHWLDLLTRFTLPHRIPPHFSAPSLLMYERMLSPLDCDDGQVTVAGFNACSGLGPSLF